MISKWLCLIYLTLPLLAAGCINVFPKSDPGPQRWALNPGSPPAISPKPMGVSLKIADVMAPSDVSGKSIIVHNRDNGIDSVDHLQDAQFSTSLPQSVQDHVIRFFEDSRCFSAIGPDHESFRSPLGLHLTIRDWFVQMNGGKPENIVLKISAKLIKSPGGKVMGQKVFTQTIQTPEQTLTSIQNGFNQGFKMMLTDVHKWVLNTLGNLYIFGT